MPASEPYVAGIDAGSSGVRCLVVSASGRPVAVARREWRASPVSGVPFGMELDAEACWLATVETLAEAVRASGAAPGQLRGVAVTSQRMAIVVVDGAGDALLASPNSDARAIAEGFLMDAGHGQRVYETTAHYPSIILAPAKLRWMHSHDAECFERARAVLPLAGYLSFRMTGELRAERGHLADCGLLDVTSLSVPEALLRDLDVDPALTLPLVRPGEEAGEMRAEVAAACDLAAGTPVFAACPDTQASLLGCGAIDPRQGGVVAGWSAPVQVVTAKPVVDPQRRTWTTVHAPDDRWIVESNAMDAGRTWAWAVRLLVGEGEDAMKTALAEAAAHPTGAGDVTAILGPTIMGPRAMSVRLGGVFMPIPMSVGEVDRGRILRATLESAVFAIRGNVEQAELVAGARCGDLVVTGGLSRSALFCQMLADALGRTLDVSLSYDTAARGAAMCAAVGVGLFPAFDAVRAMADARRPVAPDMTSAAAYADYYQRWLALDEAADTLARRA